MLMDSRGQLGLQRNECPQIILNSELHSDIRTPTTGPDAGVKDRWSLPVARLPCSNVGRIAFVVESSWESCPCSAALSSPAPRILDPDNHALKWGTHSRCRPGGLGTTRNRAEKKNYRPAVDTTASNHLWFRTGSEYSQ